MSRTALALILALGLSCGSHQSAPAVPSEPQEVQPPSQAPNRVTSEDPFCLPLPPATGRVIEVDPSQAARLGEIVASAESGDTLLLADGVYQIGEPKIRFTTPGVTLRSASGRREAVILEGNYLAERVITINASDVTVADITIHRARFFAIHVFPTTEDVRNPRIYNVHIIDPGRQAIKVNQDDETMTLYADQGEVACSHMELTDAGRDQIPVINEELPETCYTGGFDAHQARGWTIRDNRVEGFWCPVDIAQHAIHLWTGSRDTRVERNLLIDNARGIGFGLGPGDRPRRAYDDRPCQAEGDVDHYGGVISTNVVVFARPELFDSEYGADCGICLWSACGARVIHNTVVATRAPFSCIEWRFDTTTAEIANNLVSHTLLERDGGHAELLGNLEGAPLTLFRDAAGADVHLVESAEAAIDSAEVISDPPTRDIDGQLRGESPDIGADELVSTR